MKSCWSVDDEYQSACNRQWKHLNWRKGFSLYPACMISDLITNMTQISADHDIAMRGRHVRMTTHIDITKRKRYKWWTNDNVVKCRAFFYLNLQCIRRLRCLNWRNIIKSLKHRINTMYRTNLNIVRRWQRCDVRSIYLQCICWSRCLNWRNII